MINDFVKTLQAVAIVVRIIGRLFVGAAKKCLHEAAEQCKGNARSPSAALKCGVSIRICVS